MVQHRDCPAFVFVIAQYGGMDLGVLHVPCDGHTCDSHELIESVVLDLTHDKNGTDGFLQKALNSFFPDFLHRAGPPIENLTELLRESC